jgi:hypothetical protein
LLLPVCCRSCSWPASGACSCLGCCLRLAAIQNLLLTASMRCCCWLTLAAFAAVVTCSWSCCRCHGCCCSCCDGLSALQIRPPANKQHMHGMHHEQCLPCACGAYTSYLNYQTPITADEQSEHRTAHEPRRCTIYSLHAMVAPNAMWVVPTP